MWPLIGVLCFLASIVFLILGTISKFKKKADAKRNFLIAGTTFVVLIVALVASPSTEATKDTQASSSPSASASDSAPPSDDAKTKEDEKAAALAKLKAQQEADIKAKAEAEKNDPERFGKKVASKHFDSAEVKFDKDSGRLSITAPGSDNLTNNLIKKGMWMDATATLKDLKDLKDVKSVDFSITFPMVDKFGNESQSMVMKIALSAETRGKINWENFTNSNLPDIADSYWEHPALE